VEATHVATSAPRLLLGNSATVTSVQFSACGKYVMSNAADNAILFWEVATGVRQTSAAQIRNIRWFRDACSRSSGDGDGASGVGDAIAHTWRCTLGWPAAGIWSFNRYAASNGVNAAESAHGLPVCAFGDTDNQVCLIRFPAATQKHKIRAYAGHASHVTNVRWTADHTLLSTAGTDGVVLQWRILGESEHAVFEPIAGWFDPDVGQTCLPSQSLGGLAPLKDCLRKDVVKVWNMVRDTDGRVPTVGVGTTHSLSIPSLASGGLLSQVPQAVPVELVAAPKVNGMQSVGVQTDCITSPDMPVELESKHQESTNKPAVSMDSQILEQLQTLRRQNQVLLAENSTLREALVAFENAQVEEAKRGSFACAATQTEGLVGLGGSDVDLSLSFQNSSGADCRRGDIGNGHKAFPGRSPHESQTAPQQEARALSADGRPGLPNSTDGIRSCVPSQWLPPLRSFPAFETAGTSGATGNQARARVYDSPLDSNYRAVMGQASPSSGSSTVELRSPEASGRSNASHPVVWPDARRAGMPALRQGIQYDTTQRYASNVGNGNVPVAYVSVSAMSQSYSMSTLPWSVSPQTLMVPGNSVDSGAAKVEGVPPPQYALHNALPERATSPAASFWAASCSPMVTSKQWMPTHAPTSVVRQASLPELSMAARIPSSAVRAIYSSAGMSAPSVTHGYNSGPMLGGSPLVVTPAGGAQTAQALLGKSASTSSIQSQGLSLQTTQSIPSQPQAHHSYLRQVEVDVPDVVVVGHHRGFAYERVIID